MEQQHGVGPSSRNRNINKEWRSFNKELEQQHVDMHQDGKGKACAWFWTLFAWKSYHLNRSIVDETEATNPADWLLWTKDLLSAGCLSVEQGTLNSSWTMKSTLSKFTDPTPCKQIISITIITIIVIFINTIIIVITICQSGIVIYPESLAS